MAIAPGSPTSRGGFALTRSAAQLPRQRRIAGGSAEVAGQRGLELAPAKCGQPALGCRGVAWM